MNAMQYTRWLYMMYRHRYAPLTALRMARAEANQPTPF